MLRIFKIAVVIMIVGLVFAITNLCGQETHLVAEFMTEKSVNSLAFSPNGKILASSSRSDKKIKLWNVESRELLATLEGHSDNITSIAFSPDGKILASGSGDNTIKLWNIESRGCIVTMKGPDDLGCYVCSIAFSPDGKTLASGFNKGGIKLWNMETGRGEGAAFFSGGNRGVWSVAFSPNGKLLASGNDDGTVKLWDMEIKKHIATPSDFMGDSVYSVAFSPDGRILAFATDGDIWLWDVEKKEYIPSFFGGQRTIAFSPDGRILASGARFSEIKLWDMQNVQNKEPLVTFEGDTKSVNPTRVNSLAFSPDGRILASGAENSKAILLWEVNVVLPPPANRPPVASFFSFFSFRKDPAVSTKVSFDASSSYDTDGQVVSYEWDFGDGTTANGKVITHSYAVYGTYAVKLTVVDDDGTKESYRKEVTLNTRPLGSKGYVATLGGQTGTVSALAFSSDGKILASGSEDKTVKLWDVVNEVCIASLGVQGEVEDLAFSPDGKSLVVESRVGGDFYIEWWDVEKKERITTSLGRGPLTFSSDGKLLATCSGVDLMLWDVGSKKPIATLETFINIRDSIAFSVALSPNGKLAAAAFFLDEMVVVWDVESRKKIAVFRFGSGGYATSVSFSPDSVLLAASHGTGQVVGNKALDLIKVWNIEKKEMPLYTTLPKDGLVIGVVNDVAFSPDSRYLISAEFRASGRNGDILLWDIQNGDCDRITTGVSFAFSPDGRLVATGDNEGIIRLWDISAFHQATEKAVTPQGKYFTTWGEVKQTKLFQNYPNPFNPETWIPYQLADPAEVTIQIFGTTGELVRVIGLGHKPAGSYLNKHTAVCWDGCNELGEVVASGVYFYTLRAGDFTETKKMVILK